MGTRPAESCRWAFYNGADQRVRMRDVRIRQLKPEKPEALICEAFGCEKTTYDFKPFCRAHIGRMDYVGTIDVDRANAEARRPKTVADNIAKMQSCRHALRYCSD